MPKGTGSELWMLLGGVGLALLLVYLALGLYALSRADGLIFPRVPASYGNGPRLLKIPVGNGQEIAAIHLPNPDARFTLFYSHGNGEDLGHIFPLLQQYAARGYSVFAYDYPGYGLSDGVATSQSVPHAAEAALQHLVEKIGVSLNSVILYGRSVGGAPSTWLAARYHVGGLIMESSFVSAFRVMTRYALLPWDLLPNERWIKDAQCPVMVIHGAQDQIVGFWHGKALYAAAPEPKTYLWVESAGHNNVVSHGGEDYWRALNAFSSALVDRQGEPRNAISYE